MGNEQIKAENENIDKKVAELDNLINTDYKKALSALENESEKMESTKAEYEEKALLLGNKKYYLQTEEYKIEFLWTKLGNYAKDENVEIKIDVTNSQLSGRFNLNFEVSGLYTDVTQFIYDIENDSKLGFKIDDFKMQSSDENLVIGKFSCKEIRIDLKNISQTTTKNNTGARNTSGATNLEGIENE